MNHDHHHHDHGSPEAPEGMIGQELDPASRSLAEALRVSFRVLSFIMAALVIFFLASGIFVVHPDERAVVVRFGKLVGESQRVRGEVLAPGVHFSWPYPVDEVVRVPTNQQTSAIDNFWYHVSIEDIVKKREDIRPGSEGLRPGFDGALMTGDGGLVHVRWSCKWQVPANDDAAVLDYVANAADVEGLLTTAIENASIRVAATHEIEPIWRSNRAFADEVMRLSQQTLDDLRVGVRIRELQYVDQTPPLQTRDAFDAVKIADDASAQAEDTAIKAAWDKKVEAAGENWEALERAIGAYEAALGPHNEATIDTLGVPEREAIEAKYQEIVALLEGPKTGGKAKETIHKARAFRTAVVDRARAAESRFKSELQAYIDVPLVQISHLWDQAFQQIMSSEENLHTFWPKGGRYVLYVQRDPAELEALRRLEVQRTRERIEAEREARKENR